MTSNAKVSMTNYNRAVKTARTAANRAGMATWVIGDAALTVATEYGENKLKTFADDISVEIGTVRNYRTMAAKFPASDIARDLQSPTVYGIFTSQDDAFDLVRDGNAGQPWTVSAARALVKSRKDGESDGTGDSSEDGNENENTPAEVDQRAKLVSEVDRLRAELAKAEAALVRYDAENAPAGPVQHVVKGIPAHTADEPRTDCPKCKANGVTPMPAPRKASNRARRETVKASVAARNRKAA